MPNPAEHGPHQAKMTSIPRRMESRFCGGVSWHPQVTSTSLHSHESLLCCFMLLPVQRRSLTDR